MTQSPDDRIQNSLSEWNTREASKGVSVLSDNSNLKVEHYELPLSQTLVLGTPLLELPGLSAAPNTKFKPVRAVCNSPSPLFVMIRQITISNCPSILVNEQIDSYTCRIGTDGLIFHVPEMAADDTITISAFYTGLVPELFVEGTELSFLVMLFGSYTILQSE